MADGDGTRSLIYCFGTGITGKTNTLISVTVYDPGITCRLVDPAQPVSKPSIVDLRGMRVGRPQARVTTTITDFDAWIEKNRAMLDGGRNGYFYRLATNLYERAINSPPYAVATAALIDRYCAERPINRRISKFPFGNTYNICHSKDAVILFNMLVDFNLGGAFTEEQLQGIFINRVCAPWIQTIMLSDRSSPIPVTLEACRGRENTRILSRTKDGVRTLVSADWALLLFDRERLSFLLMDWRDEQYWGEGLKDMLVLSGELPGLIFREDEITPWRSF